MRSEPPESIIAGDEPPTFWIRCYKCGNVVKTTDCIREMRETVSYRSGIGSLRVKGKLYQEQLVDICFRCVDKEKKTENINKNKNILDKIFSSLSELFQVK